MNMIDATPEHSFGGRATLCPEHYPFVNGMLRTNTFRIQKIGNPVYGKQILNDACSTPARNGVQTKSALQSLHCENL